MRGCRVEWNGNRVWKVCRCVLGVECNGMGVRVWGEGSKVKGVVWTIVQATVFIV